MTGPTPPYPRVKPPVCAVCGAPAATVDLAHGFRCGSCPPTYSASYAATLRRWGFPGLAAAHRRTHIALLRQRIDARKAAA